MEFAILYKWRSNVTNGDTRKMRSLFIAWDPPEGLTVDSHYHFARGGGIVTVEVDDASVLFEALAPFTPIVEFDIEPTINAIEAVAISMDVDEWLESVNSGAVEQKPG
jgi:Domain of unknown function (DUF3303)